MTILKFSTAARCQQKKEIQISKQSNTKQKYIQNTQNKNYINFFYCCQVPKERNTLINKRKKYIYQNNQIHSEPKKHKQNKNTLKKTPNKEHIKTFHCCQVPTKERDPNIKTK